VKGGVIIEALEGFFSVILGIIIGIGVGIGFFFRLIYLMLKYLIGKLIGLIRPSAKYRINLKWLLRDCDREKDAVLHTGMLRKFELKGGEADRTFKELKQIMERYKAQRKRRSEVGDKSVLDGIFRKIDDLYNAFLKQCWIAEQSIDWKRIDLYNPTAHPAFASMRKAVSGLQTLLDEHEKMLTNAIAANVQDAVDLHDLEQGLAFVQDFNASQVTSEEFPANAAAQAADADTAEQAQTQQLP